MNKGTSENKKIGLALSGGGIRAAAFHAGVLLWLAEQKWLELVEHISTVSGGSLFMGLLFKASNYKWVTSEQYRDQIYPEIKKILCNIGLQDNAYRRLFFHSDNWKYLLARANIVAQTIESSWEISAKLGDLPTKPIWSINATNAENAKRFRFQKKDIGDYLSGYADAPNYQLSKAMAVSAAYPVGIGPLCLPTNDFIWYTRKPWKPDEPPVRMKFKSKQLHLYDGGVYDNLGLEPFFDVGKQKIKDHQELDFLIVSDAGAPYEKNNIPYVLSPKRLKKIIDITMDQSRALRIRPFVNFLIKNNGSGMYLQIGSNPVKKIKQFSEDQKDVIKKKKVNTQWLSDDEVIQSVSYPTNLKTMDKKIFEMIARHGYETSLWNDYLFS